MWGRELISLVGKTPLLGLEQVAGDPSSDPWEEQGLMGGMGEVDVRKLDNLQKERWSKALVKDPTRGR